MLLADSRYGPAISMPRADPASRIHLAAPLQQLLVIATGVPNRRDAVGDQQAHRRRTRFREVRVHLDKPGHHEAAPPVDDASALRDVGLRRGTNIGNAVAADDDGGIRNAAARR